MKLLDSIKSPSDIKKFDIEKLELLSEEIRREIIDVITRNGGHIASNLGVVELTIALHFVFDSPKDSFVFDVSHQTYVHKLLTGRNSDIFRKIRKTGGISGFLNRSESEHDCYGGGHAGCAISAALGISVAKEKNHDSSAVISVIGDGSLTCGTTMEALNNVVSNTKRMIIILNDNKWSIAKNVGAIAKYLNEIITHPIYNRLHDNLESFLKKIPGGESVIKFGGKAKTETKDLFLPSSLFEKYGLRYIGPIDGHDIKSLIQYLEFCKNAQEPIFLHIQTVKGKGLESACENPEKFHGFTGFDKNSGVLNVIQEQEKFSENIDYSNEKSETFDSKINLSNENFVKFSKTNEYSETNDFSFCEESSELKQDSEYQLKSKQIPSYQDVFGETLIRMAKKNHKIVAITAAMTSGTGLTTFSELCKEQFFDVGIAEGHAVVFAAGLASKGLRPFCVIYSTFLQRAFDMVQQDVCLQNLPVTFCIDRAGLTANDGPTHHGLYDLSFLRATPNAIVVQPKDENELIDILHSSIKYEQPTFIRYPRGEAIGVPLKNRYSFIHIGKSEIVKPGNTIAIWALGPFVYDAIKVANAIEELISVSVCVVNTRFVKPLDSELLISHTKSFKLIVTIEDHSTIGGLGSAISEFLANNDCQIPLKIIGWPDSFISHATNNNDLKQQFNLSPKKITDTIIEKFENIKTKS